jgi:hypothetical protein
MPGVAGVAQLVEQWFCKPQVGGSTPSAGTSALIFAVSRSLNGGSMMRSHMSTFGCSWIICNLSKPVVQLRGSTIELSQALVASKSGRTPGRTGDRSTRRCQWKGHLAVALLCCCYAASSSEGDGREFKF